MKYIVFWIILFNFITFSACSQRNNPEDDFNVLIINDGKAIEITEYIGTSTDIRIPSRIQKLPVIVIGDEAFFNKQITSIIIPNNIVKIGNYSFASNYISNISIPNEVTHIGDGAFSDNQINNVIITNSVTHIGKMAFAWNQINSFSIPNKITRIEDLTFAWNKLSNITIPDSVSFIGNWAFTRNQFIHLSIPNSVVFIGNGAFRNNQLDHTNVNNSRIELYAMQMAQNDLQRLIDLARENKDMPDEYAFLILYARNNYKNSNLSFNANFSIRSLLEAFESRREILEVLETYYLNDLQKNATLIKNITIGSNVRLDNGRVFDDELDIFIRENRIRAGNYSYNNGTWVIN